MSFPILRRIIFPLYRFRIKIKGVENIPRGTGLILAANHQSFLDAPLLVIALTSVLKKKIYFLTAPYICKFFGTFASLRWLGMIRIKKECKSESLEVAAEYLKQGRVIGIFPEGTRNAYSSEILLPGKTGAVRLALKSHCPIIPIGILTPPTRNIIKSFQYFFFPPSRPEIIVGSPIYLNQYYNREINNDLLHQITREIMKEIGRLCGKEYPH